MTDIHNTHPTNDIIATLADDLHASLATSNDRPLDTLRDQVKMLHYMHTLMIKEAQPSNTKYGSKKHDPHRLSLALRAQNQFCRTLMVMDHLEQREVAKQKSSNELKNSIIF
jgi:hypothetical protein